MSRRAGLATVLLAAAVSISTPAFAHSGRRASTTAELTRPASVGEVVDDLYIFSWIDEDATVASEAATIDFYYTDQNPPVYRPGTIPPELHGTPIVRGVRVHDKENSYAWDTSHVPAGSYWIWSVVNEPDSATLSKRMIHFSPGVVTIAHDGDPIAPAVVLSPPDNPYRWPATTKLDIGYDAFDPDETGQVTIEAIFATDMRPSAPMLMLARELPATPHGQFEWDTSELAEGDWVLRVTMTDARGMTFSAYDRHYRFVNHPEGDEETIGESGCSSVKVAGGSQLGALAMLLGGAMLLRRRRS
jgi:hypothetical protein